MKVHFFFQEINPTRRPSAVPERARGRAAAGPGPRGPCLPRARLDGAAAPTPAARTLPGPPEPSTPPAPARDWAAVGWAEGPREQPRLCRRRRAPPDRCPPGRRGGRCQETRPLRRGHVAQHTGHRVLRPLRTERHLCPQDCLDRWGARPGWGVWEGLALGQLELPPHNLLLKGGWVERDEDENLRGQTSVGGRWPPVTWAAWPSDIAPRRPGRQSTNDGEAGSQRSAQRPRGDAPSAAKAPGPTRGSRARVAGSGCFEG